MNEPFSPSTGTRLRQRMIEDMSVRGFSVKTRHDYIRGSLVSLLFSGGRRILPRLKIFAGFNSQQREA